MSSPRAHPLSPMSPRNSASPSRAASASPSRASPSAERPASQSPAPLSYVPRRYAIFSYGSNHSKQLHDRCGGLILGPVRGYINNYARIFAGYSSRWEGGVASIHPVKDKRVYGSVFFLDEEQLAILDQWEGGYHRSVKQVIIPDKEGKTASKVFAFVYIKNNTQFSYLPSQSYMKAIRRMLDETNKGIVKAPIDIRGVMEKNRVRTVATYNADGTFLIDKALKFPRDFPLLCGPTEQEGGTSNSAPKFTIPKILQNAGLVPIFSYGSNNIHRLRENYGTILNGPLPAYLPDYMRVFGGHSPSWEGAVASVFPAKGKRCYGAIIFVTERQLLQLDKYEGLGFKGWYTREILPSVVTTPHGEVTLPCFCYIKEDVDFVQWPSVPYMKTIRTLLEDVNFHELSKNIPITMMQDNQVYAEGHFRRGRVLRS